ncbi:DEAD/DEAH box helicase [Nocardioides marmoraquaticus]
MSFVPLTGPATWLPREPPRESEVEFTGRGRTLRLPVPAAIPVLTRAVRADDAHPSVGLLGGATLLAMQLVARGAVRADDAGSWRAALAGSADEERVRALATARAHADAAPDEAEEVVRELLDAVADAMVRRPGTLAPRQRVAEPQVTFRARPVDPLDHRDLASQVRLALRVEAPEEVLAAGAVEVVLQVHDQADETHVADAARLWTEGPDEHGFSPRARIAVGVALREAALAWTVLDRLQREQVPDRLVLEGDELAELLDSGLEALDAVGVDVLWPRSLRADLLQQARVESRGSTQESTYEESPFGPEALFGFDWRLALQGPDGTTTLNDDEMVALAEATTPVVRLRDNWVVVDPALARRAKKRVRAGLGTAERELGAGAALQAALTGVLEVEGRTVEVHPGATLERLRDRVVDADQVAPLPDPPGLEATLRDYQRRGLTWLAELTGIGVGACLADDMGLGKTVTVIALHLHRRARGLTTGPTLVVCPTSLLGTWEGELRRFAPQVAVRRFHGGTRSLDGLDGADGGVVLTTYGTMRADHETLAGVRWDLVVADEAQHVKNPRSATARHLREIPSRCRVALTGTPVENNLVDLWAILDWATPGLLGSRAAFRRAWAAPIESGVDPAVARRFAQLVGPFLLRRRKSDPGVAPELPAKTETDHVVALTQEQVVLYETLVRESMRRIREADPETRRGLVLAMLTGLKQICNHPAHYLRAPNGRLRGRSGKLELLDELVSTVVADETSGVLVFTQYVEMARLVERHLAQREVPTLFLHGGTTARERERMVRDFQDGRAPVFLLSLKAGGTGLTLTRADHVVHLDRWWNPAVEDQATDRAHRIGQTRAVQVHRLVTEGTIEQRIGELLVRKRSLADRVLGAESDVALTELSDDELDDLVRLDARLRRDGDLPGA